MRSTQTQLTENLHLLLLNILVKIVQHYQKKIF